MKKILLSVLLSSLALVAARADLIWYEGFNYADGVLTNVAPGVWIKHSGSTSGSDSLVANHRLQVGNRQDDVNRPFAAAPYNAATMNLFASFTVNCTNVPTASNYFAHFFRDTSTFHARTWNAPGSLPGTWKIGITTASGTIGLIKFFPVDLATNTDYQVVINVDETQGGNSIASLWVNPISSSDSQVVANDAVTGITNVAFAFRQPGTFNTNSGNIFNITNLATATTFDEAATNVWSTNAVVPAIVYQPKGGTNFPGNSVLLTAVANGQGLGSLTYTWLKNGALYDDPNNSPDINQLFFPSAAESDSGDYLLVVTTPYGLSATSTVANLWVTNSPIPPIITKQPTNTSVYFGQTANLSVSVIGPGSINYTWKRNGALVSPAPNSDGPVLTIVNVQTNNNTTGTYTCSVSNEFGGVVSANAVLSAIPIPSPSIAFLRTLVDANYQATNNTQIYQVTGTVTTLTNLTTGNTSSYYLQDGTAGINIFATHASAASVFRPVQGDVLTFVGVLSSFQSTLELVADTINNPAASYTVHSNAIASLPAPVAIPFNVANNLANVETNLEGRIVMLTNVFFGTNAGKTITTAANSRFSVTNGAGQSFQIFFSSQDLDTAGLTLPDYAATVIGPLTESNSVYAVTVTRFSDIVTNPLSLTQAAPGVLSWTAAPVTYPYSVRAASDVAGPYVAITNKLRFTDANGSFTDPNAGGSQKYYRLSTP